MSFYDSLERYGDMIALEDTHSAMTYHTVASEADRIAQYIQPRSLVFCISENKIESPVGYLGMLRKRAIPIMINPTLDNSLYEELKNAYQPQFIWCPSCFAQGKQLISFGTYVLSETGAPPVKTHSELALLLTTSGSTGSPKLVRQTYKNLNTNTQSIMEYLSIQTDDRAITTLPLSYTYGLSILQSHLLAGARVIFTERTFMEQEFWQIFKEKKATTFGGVPYTYEMLDKLRFLEMDLCNVRYITQAGGKLGKDLHYKYAQGMRAQGKAFIVMYGATEATARMSYVPAKYAVEKAGSIGIAIPGGRFELIDSDGTIITESEVMGELIYYGENVTHGYAECLADLAKGDEKHGRLETGDMAKMDMDGYYYVTGRKNRFLKLFGNRINLMEVEGMLAKKGYSCACVGEDDHMRIYTTSNQAEEIHHYISDTTRIHKSAFTVIHIERIPRNDSGKVLYAELE